VIEVKMYVRERGGERRREEVGVVHGGSSSGKDRRI
jgi:hypothetical protein